MRFVNGADLRSLGALPPPRAAAIVARSAPRWTPRRRRLVNRDVKPGNVLLVKGDHVEP